MPNNKSTGIDGLSVKIVKHIIKYIMSYLIIIMNNSLKLGVFPDEWKIVKLIPIHKSEPKENCANFRLISVLPILSKVIEKFVSDEISNYLSVNNLLNKMQFGFKKSNSTRDALLYIKREIIMSRNGNCYCAVINLDLEKAFGSVSHDLLMIELLTLGADDIVLHWFKSYLSNRTQFVFWRKTKSKGFLLKAVY